MKRKTMFGGMYLFFCAIAGVAIGLLSFVESDPPEYRIEAQHGNNVIRGSLCGERALLCARVFERKHPVRLVSGWNDRRYKFIRSFEEQAGGGNWGHVQAQAKIDGKWRWLTTPFATVRTGK